MLRFFAAMAVLVFPLAACALTVEDAVKLALESNNLIKNKMSLVQAREYDTKNAVLVYFPSVGLSYGYNHYWDNLIDAGGGRVGSNYDSSAATVSANLNIFNGFYDKSSVDIARIDTKMADINLASTNYDVVLEARLAFIAVLKAQRDVMVAEENLQLLQRQKRDAQISADNGLIARNDLLNVETYLASAELQRINAESALAVARNTLERVINRPLAPGEILAEPPLEDVDLKNAEELKDLMYANNSNLKYLEETYNASKKSETMAAFSLYPRVDLKASFSEYGDEVWAFSKPGSGNKDSSAALGVTASWNILDAFSGYYQSRSRKMETQAAAYNIADTKQSLTLELRTDIENYYTSRAQLRQSEISVTSAEENYRVIKNQYDQSAATMTDLLNASVLLNEARVAKSSAIYGIISAVYKLERLLETQLKPVAETKIS